MVVVSHLSLFLGDKIRGRCDSFESHLPLIKTIYFPIAPFVHSIRKNSALVSQNKTYAVTHVEQKQSILYILSCP